MHGHILNFCRGKICTRVIAPIYAITLNFCGFNIHGTTSTVNIAKIPPLYGSTQFQLRLSVTLASSGQSTERGDDGKTRGREREGGRGRVVLSFPGFTYALVLRPIRKCTEMMV